MALINQIVIGPHFNALSINVNVLCQINNLIFSQCVHMIFFSELIWLSNNSSACLLYLKFLYSFYWITCFGIIWKFLLQFASWFQNNFYWFHDSFSSLLFHKPINFLNWNHNWHNIILFQHNDLIFVYIAEWLPTTISLVNIPISRNCDYVNLQC